MKDSYLSSVVGSDDGLVIVEAARRDMRSRNADTNRKQGNPDWEYIKDVMSTDEGEIEGTYIDSDTFKPTGRKLGRGCWGRVDVYTDAGGLEWGIKLFSPNETARRQMEERGWTEEDVMRREAVPIYAAHRHVVPRLIERDKNGRMFIAMPVYEEDLSNKLYNLSLEQSLRIARDVVDAISYSHEQKYIDGKRIAHGDVKPSNIFIRDKRAFLGDWGSATCVSIGGNGGKRGPHGDENYRAPECFIEDAKPSTRADIWSLGSILYEAIAKQGIYEGISNAQRRSSYLTYLISEKIRKNVPRPFRKFLNRCLDVEPDRRYQDGEELQKGFEKAMKKYEKTKLPSRLRRWGIAAAAAVVLASASAGFVRMQNTADNLKGQVAKISKDAESERKRANIRSFLMKQGEETFGKSFYTFASTLGGEHAVNGWLSIFKDKQVGLAAYLDSKGVFEAMIEAGIDPNDTSFDYAKIIPILKERNSSAYWNVDYLMNNNYIDSWMLRGDLIKDECVRNWDHLKKSHKQRQIEEEKAKQEKLKEDMKKAELDRKMEEALNPGLRLARQGKPFEYTDLFKRESPR